MAHIVWFYKDDGNYSAPIPSVSRQVGPTLGRQAFRAFDDVALVNNLIISVYKHYSARDWPCEKLPPPNGDYTGETDLFTRDWQRKMRQRKPDGNVSPLPVDISWARVFRNYFIANLANAAALYMQETRSGSPYLNLIEELKKIPQLGHLDNDQRGLVPGAYPQGQCESGSSNGILAGEAASLTGRMWMPPGSR